MATIDISGLNIDELTDLVGKAQAEMASRERERRKDLRAELERRVAADGYTRVTSSPSSVPPMEAQRAAEAPGQVPQPSEPR